MNKTLPLFSNKLIDKFEIVNYKYNIDIIFIRQ